MKSDNDNNKVNSDNNNVSQICLSTSFYVDVVSEVPLTAWQAITNAYFNFSIGFSTPTTQSQLRILAHHGFFLRAIFDFGGIL